MHTFLSDLVLQYLTPRNHSYPALDSVWLGGQDIAIEGTFVWTSSGGQPLSIDLRWGASMNYYAVKCVYCLFRNFSKMLASGFKT